MTDIVNSTTSGRKCLNPTRPRTRRYPFVAAAELVDLRTETQIRGLIRDLSAYGCNINTRTILPAGTKVRIRIAHGTGTFVSLGRIVHSKLGWGMGVAFIKIEHNHELLLERWLAELRVTEQ